MKREQLIQKWIDELQYDDVKLTAEQRRRIILMLSSLDKVELMRFFLIADNDHGMSCARIAIRYKVRIGFVKSQIRKSRELIQKLTAL